MYSFRRSIGRGVFVLLTLLVAALAVGKSEANAFMVNARSAVVVDMSDGKVLFEQNPDALIAPASITKILSLYIVFEAVSAGEVHLSDMVPVSARAASTGGSRMGLRTGQRVSLDALTHGMAIVSGNDACVAVAEYLSGSVDEFVKRMNAKARQLGMNSSRFMTPNGLPAAGQLTTARDIAKLSTAYLTRFPDSLQIHCQQSYTFNGATHHNANRLLGKCPGVDGLKTGFVCASGYNITATGKRSDTRILAVVLGAPSPYTRLIETSKLLEAAFRTKGLGVGGIGLVQSAPAPRAKAARSHGRVKHASVKSRASGKATRTASAAKSGKGRRVGGKITYSEDRCEAVAPVKSAKKKGKVVAASAASKKGKASSTVQLRKITGSKNIKAQPKNGRTSVSKSGAKKSGHHQNSTS